MNIQATRYTPQQLAYLEHWEAKGYTFAPGELPPMSTLTPPSLATRSPKLDALTGALIIISVIAIAGTWLGKAAGLL